MGSNAIGNRIKRTQNTFLYSVKASIFKGFQREATFYYPNWWYTVPMAVHSFLEEYNFAGKTVIPFVTHGTGGLAGTIRDIRADLPVVYMTTEISEESLMVVYEALGASPSGKIAVKLSTGEPGSNYLRTDLIGDLVMSLDTPTIVECNTAYGGFRHSRSPQTGGSSR